MINIGEIVKCRVTAIAPDENKEINCLNVVIDGTDIAGIIPISEIGVTDLPTEIKIRNMARKFMGRMMLGKVIQKDPLILSNTEALAEKRNTIKLEIGQVVEGVVVEIKRNKAIIEYEACIPMIMPSTEYSFLQTINLKYALEHGQKIKVKIIDINEDKITVSHKPFTQDNWKRILKKYRVKGQYLGKVTGLIPSGVFVALEPGLDILCSPYPFFEVEKGDEVAVEITDVNSEIGKIKGMITARALSAI